MAGYDFDLFVIGAGSGGVRAARIASQHGAKVGIAEEWHLGGTCVNVGCVPKKLLTYAAHFKDSFEDAVGFGWDKATPNHDWAKLIANKNQEIQRLNGIYGRLLEGAGVTLFEARATFVDDHTLKVGDQTVTAERILIATGGRPNLDDRPGVREHAITSDEAFFLPELPKRVVIAGGGYIAVEFAGIFHGLGAEVTQIYRGSKFLRGFDDDVRTQLMEEMTRKGVNLRFDCTIERIEKAHDCLLVQTSDEDVLEADVVMYAIGRSPHTKGLGLDAAGVKTDARGAVVVDEDYKTSQPHIYAIGDVIDKVALTPVAIAEGHALADTLYGGNPRKPSYANIPTAVFSNPPIATVGLSEEEARERYGKLDLYKATFRPMMATMSGRQEQTMMKLVVDQASQRVVGAHMVGQDGPEIVQGLAIAMNCGATKQDFDRTIGLHPSAAEEFVTMRNKVPDPEEEERKPQAAE